MPFFLKSNFPWLWPSEVLCSCGGSPIPAGIQPDAGLCPRALYLLIHEINGSASRDFLPLDFFTKQHPMFKTKLFEEILRKKCTHSMVYMCDSALR